MVMGDGRLRANQMCSVGVSRAACSASTAATRQAGLGQLTANSSRSFEEKTAGTSSSKVDSTALTLLTAFACFLFGT
jgi:hypothetical protein